MHTLFHALTALLLGLSQRHGRIHTYGIIYPTVTLLPVALHMHACSVSWDSMVFLQPLFMPGPRCLLQCLQPVCLQYTDATLN